MSRYTPADAARDLAPLLDRAPKAAVRGRWEGTTRQAGVSQRSGGYEDRDGHHVRQDGDAPGFEVLDAVIERLEAEADKPFNHVTVTWRRSPLPFRRGAVTVETRFEPAIVPRPPDDPIYERAAAARRRHWEAGGGEVSILAERGAPNGFGQTRWFGPHRRVLLVRGRGETRLATDGLSTPWAGIPDPENGVGCELVLHLDARRGVAAREDELALWADMLLGAGDLVADGYRILHEAERHGAILFCRLAEECHPLARLVLAAEGERIEDLPFGPAALLRAVPVTEAEVADRDPDEPFAAAAARTALARRETEEP